MLSEKEALSVKEKEKAEPKPDEEAKEAPPPKADAGIVEPIARSKVLIGLQLALTVFLLEGVYGLVVGFGSSWATPDAVTGVFVALGIVLVIKAIIMAYFLIYLLLSWAATDYYIAGHHLVIHYGIMATEEKVYELNHIRVVDVKQSWLGHIFNYGDIMITVAQAGVRDDIRMSGVANPSKYEEIFERFLEAG